MVSSSLCMFVPLLVGCCSRLVHRECHQAQRMNPRSCATESSPHVLPAIDKAKLAIVDQRITYTSRRYAYAGWSMETCLHLVFAAYRKTRVSTLTRQPRTS